MRTPVSRIERIAAIFIVAVLLLLGAVLFPEWMFGRSFNAHLLKITAPGGIGLTLGDKVTLKDIQVGEVSNLELDADNNVIIDCKIYRNFRDNIRSGTRAVLVPPPMIGPPQVQLTAGKGEPLPAGTVLSATIESSVADAVTQLAAKSGGMFQQVESRVEQIGKNMESLQEILDAINSGEGLAGKLIKDGELYVQFRGLLEQLDQSMKVVRRSLDSLETLGGRLEDFSQVLPALKDDISEMLPSLKGDIREASGKLLRSLTQIERGLEGFPELVSDTTSAISESRRVIESLKRNFLIRANLPSDPESGEMGPASYREPLPLE